VDFRNFQDQRKGMILVSSAGIIMNMILAFAALFLLQLLSLPQKEMPAVILLVFAKINIILAAFNLIPLPPLDGSKILMGFAPPAVQSFLLRLEKFGFIIIIGLLYMGALDPVINFFQWMILSFIGLLMP